MIDWNVSPEIFRIGSFALRWYSLMFMLSFLFGYYLMRKMYTQEHKPEKDVDAIFLFVFIGTILGARIGHCLFYDPWYYLGNPLEIFQVWQGGLASHGAAIGILLAIYFYAKSRKDQTFLWTVDRVVIVVALAGCLIRIGNLFNSEIVGAPTEVPWAFVFHRYESNPVPRHPSQIYEAIAYLLIFIGLYKTYQRKKAKTEQGLLFGLFLIGIFGFRFFVEYFKEVQVGWETGLPLHIGQFLSVPFVLIGIWLVMNSKKAGPAPASAPPRNHAGRRPLGRASVRLLASLDLRA